MLIFFLKIDFNYKDDDSDEKILTKCLKCCFEETVPSLIYKEFGRKKFHKELEKRVVALKSQRCDAKKIYTKEIIKDWQSKALSL